MLCFLSHFDFYLLLGGITVPYTLFLFLSQSNSNYADSILSLEGYLQLLSSQVENMLEVNEKIQVLPIDLNTVSNYSVLSNKTTTAYPTHCGNLLANQCSKTYLKLLKMLLSTFYSSSHWLYLKNFPQQLFWCKRCVFTVIWCSKLDGVTGQLN